MKKIVSYLLALSILASSFPSHAAYANLVPPPGWSQGLNAATATVGSTFKYASASTATTLLLGRIGAKAAVTVAGQNVVVPVGFKLAANAASIAAEYSFGNPQLFVGLMLASAVYAAYKAQDVEVKNGVWIKRTWKPCTTACVEYTMNTNPERYASSPMGAAQLYASSESISTTSGDTTSTVKLTANSCSSTNLTCTFTQTSTTTSPGGTSSSTNQPTVGYSQRTKTKGDEILTPLTKPQFHEIMDPLPLPAEAPKELPQVPFPIEAPYIFPDPAIVANPSGNPVSRPVWVPTGQPVKNPSVTGQPDTWTQPGQQITPAPSPSNPWRVDITDLPKTKTNATPNTDGTESAIPTTTVPTPTEINIETCGLPGKPKCLIDEAGTPVDKAQSYDPAKTDLDTAKDSAREAIDAAQNIETPSWSFSFQFPSSCSPINTGLRGVIIDVCQFRPMIHDLLSMVWVAAASFCIIGMVGRTIRES